MQYAGKVFGIGFHKTGTTSLAAALQHLGYKTIHGDGRGSWRSADEGRTLIQFMERGDYRLPTLELFDAFLDNPYFSIWQRLYELYPDAKFIHTIRNDDDWIESCVKYYAGRRIRPMRQWTFGAYADPSRSETARQRWLDVYRQHNALIKKHFECLDKQLLVMDITRGDGWDELGTFLGAAIPDQQFPHANQSKRWNFNRLQGRAKRSFGL